MKLRNNDRRKTGKLTNMEIKQHTLKQPMGQRSHREIRGYLDMNENEVGQVIYPISISVLSHVKCGWGTYSIGMF